ncbi:hypothetical protein IA203_05830 [Corynebacterium wankanglinii]|nr:hypothetical protein IA203_05830 [Corynebacterium wankanglinii]
MQRAQSAHLATAAEGKDVRNLVPDYPSAGTPVGVAMEGNASASSSAADATAFGGAPASRSLTAAFDGLDDTAWWPAAQDPHPWLRFTPNANTATITATANTKVQVTDSSGERTLSLVAGQPRTISVRGETTLALTEPVGITEIDAGIHRIVDVPGTADTYFFQRLMPETTTLQRAFTTAEAAELELSSRSYRRLLRHQHRLPSRRAPRPSHRRRNDHAAARAQACGFVVGVGAGNRRRNRARRPGPPAHHHPRV